MVEDRRVTLVGKRATLALIVRQDPLQVEIEKGKLLALPEANVEVESPEFNFSLNYLLVF